MCDNSSGRLCQSNSRYRDTRYQDQESTRRIPLKAHILYAYWKPIPLFNFHIFIFLLGIKSDVHNLGAQGAHAYEYVLLCFGRED